MDFIDFRHTYYNYMTIQKQLEHKAKKYAAKIIRLPFVHMVALTGSVAAGRATQKSDIDYFIQLQKKRLYIGRLVVTVAVHLWGQRRTDRSISGKLCLNWFGTQNFPKQRHRVHQILAMQTHRLMGQKIGELVTGWTEPIVRLYQIRRIQKDPRTHAQGSQVRWSDDELGFHPPKV